jgi:hypothetical protein
LDGLGELSKGYICFCHNCFLKIATEHWHCESLQCKPHRPAWSIYCLADVL